MKTKRIKTIDAGPLHEVVIYTPPRRYDTQQQRAQRQKATSKAQAAMNMKNRTKRLEYLLAANFKKTDRHVVLTYRPEALPRNRKEARAQLRALISTLRPLRRRCGLRFKYIYSTEDKHGDGQLHHHLVITAAPGDVEQLQSLWTFGAVHFKTLAEYGDDWCAVMARYMTKERKPNGEQSYTCSKDMTPPTIRTEWIDEDCALTAPRGAVVLEEGKETTAFSEYYHLKYIRPDNSGRPGKMNINGAAAPLDLETRNNFRAGRGENSP